MILVVGIVIVIVIVLLSLLWVCFVLVCLFALRVALHGMAKQCVCVLRCGVPALLACLHFFILYVLLPLPLSSLSPSFFFFPFFFLFFVICVFSVLFLCPFVSAHLHYITFHSNYNAMTATIASRSNHHIHIISNAISNPNNATNKIK